MPNFRNVVDSDLTEISRWQLSSEDLQYWAAITDTQTSLYSRLQAWAGTAYVNSFVLNLNGIIVAYGEIWIDDEEIEIARLLVNPMHRCEGFGRLLAQHLLRKARSICTNIWLRVHPQNKAALALYSKLGFTRTSVEQEACFNVNHPLQYVWMSAE